MFFSGPGTGGARLWAMIILTGVLLTGYFIPLPLHAEESREWLGVGANYLSKTEHTTGKVMLSIPVGGVQLISQTDIGRYGNENLEAYVCKPFRLQDGADFKLDGLLLAGPGVDWTNPGNLDELAYVTGAAGFGVHCIFDKLTWDHSYGIAAVLGYTFGIDNEYPDGWGVGVYFTTSL